MPNWTEVYIKSENEITHKTLCRLCGVYDDRNILEEDKAKGNRTVTFEYLIPMPDDIYRGDLGKEEMEKYGKNNWRNWSVANWGTKWDACDSNINDENKSIWFQTAWDAPWPWLDKLIDTLRKEKTSDIKFTIEFTIELRWEDGYYHDDITVLTYKDGKLYQKEVPIAELYPEEWEETCRADAEYERELEKENQ